jgi:hypothetical protein
VCVAEFEGIHSDLRPKKMDAEVELVDFSRTVGKTDRREVGMLESVLSTQFGNLLVETLAAKHSVTLLDGAIIDGVVARYCLATTTATDLVVLRGSALLHIHPA